MCDTPIARIARCVSSLTISFGDSPCNCSLAIRVNRVMLGRLCAENKTRFRGGQNLTAVEEKASIYQVNPVSRITGQGRAEVFKDISCELCNQAPQNSSPEHHAAY